MLREAAVACALLLATLARADTPEQILETYAAQARADDPAFIAFSAERGEAFYREPHAVKGAGVWSCASCHLKNPRFSVLAHRTEIPCRACHVLNDWEHPDPHSAKKRVIDAFAPSANPKRLGDAKRAETFLRLNCLLLLKRECTALEKGDVITYLVHVEGGPLGNFISPNRRPIGGVDDNDQ